MTDDQLDQRVRDTVLSEPVDTSRIEAAVRSQIAVGSQIDGRRHVPGWAVAAAAVIAMVAASALSYHGFRKEQAIPAVCLAAAQDHQTEIVRGDPRKWLSDRGAIRSLAEKQHVPVSAIAALETTGYRLERGRLCFLKKQIFLHLVYTGNGREYSVYLRPADGLFTGSVQGADNMAYFESKDLAAVFIGDGAQAFAEVARRSLGNA
jgi:hypothetical protein